MHLASDLVLTYIHGGGVEQAGGGVFEPGTSGIVEGQADPFTEYLETRSLDPGSGILRHALRFFFFAGCLFARLVFSRRLAQELDPFRVFCNEIPEAVLGHGGKNGIGYRGQRNLLELLSEARLRRRGGVHPIYLS